MERWKFEDLFKSMPNFSPSKSYGFGAGGLDDFGFGFDFTEPTAGVQAQLHDFEAALSKGGSSEPAASAFLIPAATPYSDTTGTTAGDPLPGLGIYQPTQTTDVIDLTGDDDCNPTLPMLKITKPPIPTIHNSIHPQSSLAPFLTPYGDELGVSELSMDSPWQFSAQDPPLLPPSFPISMKTVQPSSFPMTAPGLSFTHSGSSTGTIDYLPEMMDDSRFGGVGLGGGDDLDLEGMLSLLAAIPTEPRMTDQGTTHIKFQSAPAQLFPEVPTFTTTIPAPRPTASPRKPPKVVSSSRPDFTMAQFNPRSNVGATIIQQSPTRRRADTAPVEVTDLTIIASKASPFKKTAAPATPDRKFRTPACSPTRQPAFELSRKVVQAFKAQKEAERGEDGVDAPVLQNHQLPGPKAVSVEPIGPSFLWPSAGENLNSMIETSVSGRVEAAAHVPNNWPFPSAMEDRDSVPTADMDPWLLDILGIPAQPFGVQGHAWDWAAPPPGPASSSINDDGSSRKRGFNCVLMEEDLDAVRESKRMRV